MITEDCLEIMNLGGKRVMDYENTARNNFHRDGANCSQAVAAAFADKLGITPEEAMEITPPPRSIEGKCGAVLASEMILDRLGIDKKAELEAQLIKLNGTIECKRLLSSKEKLSKSCHDYVGDAARVLNSLIG